MKKFILTSIAVLMVSVSLEAQDYIANRAPLTESRFMELPIGAVKADGWLRQQLVLQKEGLTGHLDELYRNVVGPRNAWLGGDGDAWERGPYWIDGLLPLAYLLDDKGLKDKAQVWVEAILGSQKENGYFGPDTDRGPEPGLQRDNSHDWWPKMVALKIVKQYYMATGDERVIPFLDRYFRYQLANLPQTPLDNWTFWGALRLSIGFTTLPVNGIFLTLVRSSTGKALRGPTYSWMDQCSILRTACIVSIWGKVSKNLSSTGSGPAGRSRLTPSKMRRR